MDLFVVPTIGFILLCAFVVVQLDHSRGSKSKSEAVAARQTES
jgi:hypothetical protein